MAWAGGLSIHDRTIERTAFFFSAVPCHKEHAGRIFWQKPKMLVFQRFAPTTPIVILDSWGIADEGHSSLAPSRY